MAQAAISQGLLGDTPERDYSLKLRLFNAFAEPELRRAIASLQLAPGTRVLDAGCGTGAALTWFAEAIGTNAELVGIDLSAAHVAFAQERCPPSALILEADLMEAPFPPASFDVVWSVNTINHLRDPAAGVGQLAALLRPRGRLALGQSSFVPDMYFAWDARLERLTNEAVRQYYRDRYKLSEQDLTSVRAVVGLVRAAGLCEIASRTFMIERIFPLRPADEAYLQQAIFHDTWGERLRPYLSREDYVALMRLCDSQDPGYALRRPDLHFLQSFTLVTARMPA